MLQIGVAAYSGQPGERLAGECRAFVEGVARRCRGRAVLLVGGYWGLMRCVVDEALARGLPVVVMPPLEAEGAEFPEGAIVVRSGCGYRVRSVFLVRSSDVLAVLGGASGTIQEAVTGYAEGVRVVVLRSGMPSDRLEELGRLDDRPVPGMVFAGSGEELAGEVCRGAPGA